MNGHTPGRTDAWTHTRWTQSHENSPADLLPVELKTRHLTIAGEDF